MVEELAKDMHVQKLRKELGFRISTKSKSLKFPIYW